MLLKLNILLLCFYMQSLKAQDYIFFLHNKFIEMQGIEGVHPEYGGTEYPAILNAFRQEGFIVFSEVRPNHTDWQLYAKKVAGQVDSLLKKGVNPSHITVIGTSKGGYIAQYVSTLTKNPKLNFVFIGSCSDEDAGTTGINFCGNILSIYEQSDAYGQSCAKALQLSTLNVPHYKELRLNSGVMHGYLYKALPLWIKPSIQWAKGNYTLKDSSPHKDLTQKIDSLLDAPTKRPFNGLILISRNGVTQYIKSKGYSDLDKKLSLRLNEQFVIGSVSKQITAVLVLQQLEKGHLKLDIPIRFYLPDLKDKWADSVNIHQLLTHTHGIIDFGLPLAFKPGTQYLYSQIGFELMAQIVENTTKKSFAVLSDELFKSCKMENSSHPDIKQYPRLVNGYSEQTDGTLKKDSNSLMNYVAAGAFISSIHDLLLWNTSLHQGKLLSDNTYQLMIKKQEGAIRQHPIFGPTQYGYGLTISDKDSLLQLGQTGFAPGFVSMDYYFPQSKTSVIILENIAYGPDDLRTSFYYHTAVLDLLRTELMSTP